MKIKQCVYVMVVVFLLMLICVGMGWAKKKPVLDYDGNVITEAEIKANMKYNTRVGCCIGGFVGGGCLGLTYSIAVAVRACGGIGNGCGDVDVEIGNGTKIAFWGTLIVIELGAYYIGKRSDRQRAIKRIRVQRRVGKRFKAQQRQQKNHVFGEQEMTDGFRFQLLTVRF